MKHIFLIGLIIVLLSSCASFVPVSSERPAQVEELQSMDKLGVIVLLKITGSSHLKVGLSETSDEITEWAVPGYSELDASAVLSVRADDVRKKYLAVPDAAAIIGEAAVNDFGNGSVYEYRFVKGYSIRPEVVSNQSVDSAGNAAMIKGPEVIFISSNFNYNVEDRDLIPFAIKQGRENGIDGLVVIHAELITEGGQITKFNSGESTGYPVGDWNNTFDAGDFFARTELEIQDCEVLDAATGEYVAELSDELTGYTIIDRHNYYKIDGVKDADDLRNYFRSGNYRENIRENAESALSLLVQYLRPHFWTYYAAE